MIKIEFPAQIAKIRQQKNVKEIFDIIRKKWLVLTPEEWVRQNILLFLLIKKEFPASLMAIEKEVRLGELKKRCDIVIYNRNSEPWMIIECKEMNVSLSAKTLDQIMRYHIVLPAKYLIISNGNYCFGFQKTGEKFIEIHDFPDFKE